ncbi:hypothetical protein ACJMK2_007318 [Sinanodonta woodiana]|uniref:Cyclic GMP-AMP synthase n=1 Tax=Sinanodonta woodiana TaxID=1069815 RepID=A0ABD3VI73_SINWO
MCEGELRLISTNLEKILCGEGFDIFRKMIQTIIDLVEWIDSKHQVILSNTWKETKIYGSIGEGLYYPINIPCERDIDIVHVLKNIVAVENATDTMHYNTDTFMQYIESSAMQRFAQVNLADVPFNISSLVPDWFGNVEYGQLGQQGPATNYHINILFQLFKGFMSFTKFDMVFVIPCPNWPSSASEWISRARLYGWPTETQIRKIVDKGIFFAPVGCKNHPHEGFQWRYSFNEAEKRLVQSFNPTQAKCYVLLKRIISENVTVHMQEDVISSYHLKTLMFWTIEETDPILWIPANLVQCIFLCLNRLVQCVDRAYCPSYFMPDENLFITKVTEENKGHVIAMLRCIIAEGWHVIARLSNFAMDQNCTDSFKEEYEAFQMLSSDDSWLRMIVPCAERLAFPHFLIDLDVYEIHETDRIHAMFNRIINNIILETYRCDDAERKDVLKDSLASVCSSYGTCHLSLSRHQIVDSRKTNIVDNPGEIYITLSILRNKVDCLAKHANYAYMRGNFESTLSTAFNLLQNYCNRPANVFSIYVPADVQATQLEVEKILSRSLRDDSTQQGFINTANGLLKNVVSAREVLFLKNEIHAVPENVKVEMFFLDRRTYPIKPNFRFRRCLVLDPYLYVTYLAFLSYYDMGSREKAGQVLQIMEIICSNLPNSHLPSSLNQLADCYVKMGRVEKGIETLSLSMKRNRFRNAATWHVARIVWRYRTCSYKRLMKT